MAFKQVAGARTYYKYAECTDGQKLVDDGEFVGTEEGKFGVQHIFRQRDSKVVCLNSAGHLNWLVDNHVKPGSRCNVYYAGKTTLTKGAMAGKEAHNFSLEIDDEAAVTAPAELPKVAVSGAGESDISL